MHFYYSECDFYTLKSPHFKANPNLLLWDFLQKFIPEITWQGWNIFNENILEIFHIVFHSVNRYLSRKADDEEHGAAEEDPVFQEQTFHSGDQHCHQRGWRTFFR